MDLKELLDAKPELGVSSHVAPPTVQAVNERLVCWSLFVKRKSKPDVEMLQKKKKKKKKGKGATTLQN